MLVDCEKIGISLPTIAQYLLSDSNLASLPRINPIAADATTDVPLKFTAIPEQGWAALGERTVVRRHNPELYGVQII